MNKYKFILSHTTAVSIAFSDKVDRIGSILLNKDSMKRTIRNAQCSGNNHFYFIFEVIENGKNKLNTHYRFYPSDDKELKKELTRLTMANKNKPVKPVYEIQEVL